MSWKMELPCTLDSPARARHALGELSGSVPPTVLGDLRLLVSELVTNSLRHAGLDEQDTIRLTVDIGDDAVRVEVADPGEGFELAEPEPDPDSASGWGLYLVATLADRWGIVRDGPGTLVWFELDGAGAGAGAGAAAAA